MALKKQTFYNILKAFSSDTPQSIKRQNKGPKEHDEKIYTQLWIEIGQSESATCLKENYHWSPREKTNSFCLHNGGFFVCM